MTSFLRNCMVYNPKLQKYWLLTLTLARATESFLRAVRYTIQNWKILTANPNHNESHDLFLVQLYGIQSQTENTDC